MNGQIRYISSKEYNLSELDVFSRTPERLLFRYFEPAPGLFVAEGDKVVHRALDAGYEPYALLAECAAREGEDDAGKSSDVNSRDPADDSCARIVIDGFHFSPAVASVLERVMANDDVPVYAAPLATLERALNYHLTGGVVCAMRRRLLPTLDDVCKSARRIAVLEAVTNPTNVGAIFRSAAAMGVDAVLLTSASCDPLYRRSVRVSMGCVFQISWTVMGYVGEKYMTSATRPLQKYLAYRSLPDALRSLGFSSVALALKDDALPIDAPVLKQAERLAIFLGAEGDGLSSDTIEGCDYTARIPMSHGVDSLNVAAASAVAFWELCSG